MKDKEQQLTRELVRQELAQLIDNIDNHNELTLEAARARVSAERREEIRLKSTPYLSLRRRGLITVDYLIEEFDRIQDRTSRHSSNERRCIINLVMTAIHNAAVKQAKEQEDNEKNANDNDKTAEEENASHQV